MKNKILNLLFAFLLGCFTPFIIFYSSGKHQQAKESDRIDIDTFQVVAKCQDLNDSLKFIYTTKNSNEWINYINTNIEYVVGYDQVYYSVKK
jgi:hypothetical protein